MKNVQVWARISLFWKTVFCVGVFATALLVVFFPLLNRLPYRVPIWVAQRAQQQIGQLRPGMTEQEVWSTLGLTGRGFKAHVNGSGPPNAFPANYVLWPGYVLHTRWDYRTKPVTLVDSEFREHL